MLLITLFFFRISAAATTTTATAAAAATTTTTVHKFGRGCVFLVILKQWFGSGGPNGRSRGWHFGKQPAF
jgi:hypothetical protein